MTRYFQTVALGVLGVACSSQGPHTVDGGGDVDVDAVSQQQETGASCCKDDINSSAVALNSRFDASWLAWKYTPSCSLVARDVWVASDAPAVAILSDDSGKPGSVLVPESPTMAAGNGVHATLPMLSIDKARPVWIAIRNSQPGSIGDGSHTPFATSGASTSVSFASQNLMGSWMPSQMAWPIIFRVSSCP